MLTQKKIPTKKLAIYISIIFFMVGGTGFMLYKNKNLTAHKLTNVNSPIVFNNPIPVTSIELSKNNTVGTNGANNLAVPDSGQLMGVADISQNGGFNLNIFSNEKFKNLRENIFLFKEQPEVGKRDPFKPN